MLKNITYYPDDNGGQSPPYWADLHNLQIHQTRQFLGPVIISLGSKNQSVSIGNLNCVAIKVVQPKQNQSRDIA